jgi:peptide chain release factor 2
MIPEADLKIEILPKHPLGGQQVGLHSTRVRVTHMPTGITAEADCARSQLKNRDICVAMIEAALTDPELKL